MRRLTKSLISLLGLLSLAGCGTPAPPVPSADLDYENPLYSYEEASPLALDSYCPYDAEYLTTLREKYELEERVKGCAGDFEKVQRIAEWVTNLWAHDGMNIPPKGDPLSVLDDVTERGARYRCVEYGSVIFGCLNALDIPTRSIGLKTSDVETRELGAGHVAVEVWLADLQKWVFVDGQWGMIPLLGDVPLNAVQLGAVLAHPEKYEETLTFLNFGTYDTADYPVWIGEYLYHLDIGYTTAAADGMERHSLMLVPTEAPDPHVFQINYPLEMEEYTHSVVRFYTPPTD